jgi:hypothetical protein
MLNIYDWTYSESEGPNCTRYDFMTKTGEEASVWLYNGNQLEGHLPKSLKSYW